MEVQPRSPEINNKKSKGNHLRGFRKAFYSGEEKKAIGTFDKQTKKNKKDLKLKEGNSDKDFMKEDHRSLDVRVLMEYADKRSVLPAEKAITRQEDAEHLHEARDKADLKIMQGGKKLEVRIYYRDMAQDKINREERNYHYEFNRLRYQRG